MKKNNWILFLINGIIAILLGLMAIFVPSESIIAVARYFGLVVLIAGVVIFILSLNKKESEQNTVVTILEAIMAIIIGLIILFYTKQTLTIFAFLMAIWAVVIGLLQLALALWVKSPKINNSLLATSGFIALVFGIILFFNPFESIKAFTVIAGIIALFVGLLMVYFAIRIRSLKI